MKLQYIPLRVTIFWISLSTYSIQKGCVIGGNFLFPKCNFCYHIRGQRVKRFSYNIQGGSDTMQVTNRNILRCLGSLSRHRTFITTWHRRGICFSALLLDVSTCHIISQCTQWLLVNMSEWINITSSWRYFMYQWSDGNLFNVMFPSLSEF